MAKVFTMASRSINRGASVTVYDHMADMSMINNATEANTQIIYRTAGTFSNFYAVISSNDRGASTIKLRVNGANVNGNLSVGSSTTGEFWDQTNTDAVVAGDKVSVQIITGAGGTNFTHSFTAILFSATGGTVKKFGTEPVIAINTASTTFYIPISGGFFVPTTTEANAQFKFKTAGVFQNACINVITNARGTASTYRTRKGGANGNITISIPSSTTGFLEDTSNTDTVAVDDLWNQSLTLDTGSGDLLVNVHIEFSTTNEKTHLINSGDGGSGTVVNAGVTTYFPIAGRLVQNTTESVWRTNSLQQTKLSNLECYISANTIVASSTLRVRVNGANGNQSVSIPSLTTGYFEDTTNTDSVILTDEINYQIVTGSTATSLTIHSIGVLATPSTYPGAFNYQLGNSGAIRTIGARGGF